MKYAKLTQSGSLNYATKTVTWQGRTVNNPSADKLLELGYLPVTYVDVPTDAQKNKYYESSYEYNEDNTTIIQKWTLKDYYAIGQLRTKKLEEVSSACESTIYSGINVELSDGESHFSLTEKDQINIFGLQTKIENGQTKIEYHSDGNPCKYYSIGDIQILITEAMKYVSYHTTYCNSLNMWIKQASTIDELNSIYYGIEIPEEYQSEVLKSYLASN